MDLSQGGFQASRLIVWGTLSFDIRLFPADLLLTLMNALDDVSQLDVIEDGVDRLM